MPDPADDIPLDRRAEARLMGELAAIKRTTEKGWKEDTFWSWLVKRLTLTSRREKR